MSTRAHSLLLVCTGGVIPRLQREPWDALQACQAASHDMGYRYLRTEYIDHFFTNIPDIGWPMPGASIALRPITARS